MNISKVIILKIFKKKEKEEDKVVIFSGYLYFSLSLNKNLYIIIFDKILFLIKYYFFKDDINDILITKNNALLVTGLFIIIFIIKI